MSNVVRASFSLDGTSVSLLKLISDYDLRPMSAEVRYLVRERANYILGNSDANEDIKAKIRELLVIHDEIDTN